MPRMEIITHAGKRVASLDFSGIPGEAEGLAAIADAAALVQAQGPKSVYTLTNVTDARFNAATLAAMKTLAVDNAPHVRAGAVFGMGTLQKAAYLTVMYFSRRQIPAFDTREQALAWIEAQE
ncbi:MAG TPA: hypothetical protein VFI39_10175 [Gemmatimonadales bacterium]|nr:hypothetical protein [Gemmatimonadales bacterium]